MRISHPPRYTYISSTEVPEGFYVKCYPIHSYKDDEKLAENDEYDERKCIIDYWEIDYGLKNKSIRELLRYRRFKSFEEAAVACNLLGLKCVECKWLFHPPLKTDDGWAFSMTGLHPDGDYVPVEGYEEAQEKLYREKLGDHYDEFFDVFPAWKTQMHS